MPDFDVFVVLECKKRKSRSHGKRKNGNIKRKICTEKRLNTSLKDLSLALTYHGRYGLFSFLSSLPISVLRNLELATLIVLPWLQIYSCFVMRGTL